MMEGDSFYRMAGWSTWLALVALIISAVALALFFGGAGEFWGPINDALIAVALLALIPAILAVDRLATGQLAPWVRIITVAAILGIALATVGNVLLIVGRLSLEGSYVTGGIGIAPVLAWIALVAVLSLGSGLLPPVVGWLSVASLALVVMGSIVAAATTGVLPWVASIAFVIGISAWLGGLAVELSSRAANAT